jgi:hypothetical protein
LAIGPRRVLRGRGGPNRDPKNRFGWRRKVDGSEWKDPGMGQSRREGRELAKEYGGMAKNWGRESIQNHPPSPCFARNIC